MLREINTTDPKTNNEQPKKQQLFTSCMADGDCASPFSREQINDRVIICTLENGLTVRYLSIDM